tara:strand:+ start:988 stop:1569 length:582 start_codon:yes stop_codon:yes gene_type:complete
MKKQVTDAMGTYEVNIKNKPQELINTADSAIYLNLFDNGESENACRYKLSLGVSDAKKKKTDWHCNILNHYEASRWLRQVPEEHKGKDFYKQTQYQIVEIKKAFDYFDKSPSAGFFKAPRSKGMSADKRPIIPNATAMMFIEKDQLPYVYMRFMDMHWDGYLELTGKRHPKWSICMKSSSSEEVVEIDYDEYF